MGEGPYYGEYRFICPDTVNPKGTKEIVRVREECVIGYIAAGGCVLTTVGLTT